MDSKLTTENDKKKWVKSAMRVKSGKDITRILKRYWGLDRDKSKQDIVATAKEVFG